MLKQQAAPYPYLKWLTDKLVPLTFLILFFPILVVIVLVMAVSMLLRPVDRGAWFYRERRMSRGRSFDLLKFRVLREDVINQMPCERKHAREYEADTSNLTWAGRYFLKNWYLDELPQLFNILKGDMSLVGPRPWPLHMANAQIGQGVVYRKLIQAGWTGPVQLQKGNPTPPNSTNLDLEYFNRCLTEPGWRLWLYDMNVLYQTVWLVLEGKGLRY